MNILIVEDERRLVSALAQIMRDANYTVDAAYDGDQGLDMALTGMYDVIVLDIMLPKLDGISVLRALRDQRIATPVILLTAKGETEDKVKGLDSGADDYLAKPFPASELLARLRALTRRSDTYLPKDFLCAGNIELDSCSLELRSPSGSFRLTRKEYQLLELLLRSSGTTVSAGSIIEKLWGYENGADERNVQVYISFLRKKLLHLNASIRIETLRGVGYTLQEKPPGEDTRKSESPKQKEPGISHV